MMSLYGLITLWIAAKAARFSAFTKPIRCTGAWYFVGTARRTARLWTCWVWTSRKRAAAHGNHPGKLSGDPGGFAEKLHFDHPGTGIAFTCALSGISVAASELVEKVNKDQQNPMTQKEDMPMEAQPMEMIITVVDSGSTDLVVDAAKAAGAHGGTVIKAREIDGDEQKKIFGMIVQPEKEIVLMLVRLGAKERGL